MLEKVSNSADNLSKLIDNLSEWYNPQKQKDLENSKLELVNLFLETEETLRLLSGSASQKKIILKNEIPDELSIKSNNGIFSTCIRNFVTNAIKFTNEGGTIRVYSEEQNDSIKICVSDNGVGMTKEQIKSLFSEIGMGYTTIGTNGEKGTGFGLSLCKEIVEGIGGKISAESDGEGKGSTFTIILPKNIE